MDSGKKPVCEFKGNVEQAHQQVLNKQDGGWIPVVKRRGRHTNQVGLKEGRREGMYTLFVDNLPESMDPRSMYALFLKFGVVKDVFIPQKRWKATNTRFGFVRFNCPVAASVAEQKANEIWVDDKALIVHSAVYGKEKGDQMRWKQVQRRHLEIRRPSDITGPKRWNQGIDGRSYVEVIKGAQPGGQHTTTIKVEEIGNGWLYESMIMRLKPDHSAMEVQGKLKEQGMKDVRVRAGGGHDVVLSFNSVEALKSTTSKLNVWFKDWCEYITEWTVGMQLQQERSVWISCYGVPLNLWSSNTFTKIGRLWGEVIQLDGDICEPSSFCCGKIKIVTSRVYPIRVCEEHIINEVSSCGKGINNEDGEEGVSSNTKKVSQSTAESKREVEDADKDEEVEADMAQKYHTVKGGSIPKLKEGGDGEVGDSCIQISVVKETEECMGKSSETGSGVGETMMELEGLQQQQLQTCSHALGKGAEIQKEEGLAAIKGFIRSLSETQKIRPGIHLEVALGQEQLNSQPIALVHYKSSSNEGGLKGVGYKSNSNDTISDSIGGSINNQINQGPRSVTTKEGPKYPLAVGGFSGLIRRIGQESVGARRRKVHQKKMVPRSKAEPRPNAVVGQHSCESDKLLEAQATVCLGKSLGIDFKGQEEEIINKITQLEVEARARVGGGD
ncbi:hypothetical protein ACSBR2_004608 [Camellia fascicularis]